jgi:hypothetical protein
VCMCLSEKKIVFFRNKWYKALNNCRWCAERLVIMSLLAYNGNDLNNVFAFS